jgi:methylamine--corrinoid protein Co-methyltransferase
MNNKMRVYDLINRSLTGEIIEERKYDLGLAANVQKMVKKYDIKLSSETFINDDTELLDRVWNAAIEFLATTGIYSKDTNRVVRYTEAELRSALELLPGEVMHGSGNDEVNHVSRELGDNRRMVNGGGAVGVPCPNEYFASITASYLQEPLVDCFCTPSNNYTIAGDEIRTKSPFEIVAAWEEVTQFQYVAKCLGRPGLAQSGINISVSDVGQLAAGHLLRKTDNHCYGIISELKADNTIFNKIMQCMLLEGNTLAYANPTWGGLGGGLNGQIVLLTAEMIACSVIFFGSVVSSTPTHPILFCSTTKEILQMLSVSMQSIAKHSNIITLPSPVTVGGPVTKTILYEIIANTLTMHNSAVTRLEGPRGATGAVVGACTGLEARFQGEVIGAATKISKEKAEELIGKAYAKYENDLDKKPYGKPFWEAYDVTTLTPTEEWNAMYQEVKEEAISWGLPL